MSTERTMGRSTNGEERSAGEGARGLVGDLPANARQVADAAGAAAGEVANRLPAAAATTREAIDEASRQIEAAPTDVLVAGASLSVGVALGLLLGGSPGVLGALALIPAAAMGATLLERRNRELM
jgi:hypothetical protein